MANVPQGLPATVTSLLAIATQRLAARNIFVKKLHSVEALGAASVIASDKTGTLTKNEMTVTEVWLERQFYWQEYSQLLGADDGSNSSSFDWLHRIATVCNTAYIDTVTDSDTGMKRQECHGSASETALIRFANDHRSIQRVRKRFPVRFEIPFNSRNKWHLVVVSTPDGADNEYTCLIKGAPEIVLARCDKYLSRAGAHVKDSEFDADFEAAYTRFGSTGRRVLGFAYATFTVTASDQLEQELPAE